MDKEHTYDQCRIFYNKGRKEELKKAIKFLDSFINKKS